MGEDALLVAVPGVPGDAMQSSPSLDPPGPGKGSNETMTKTARPAEGPEEEHLRTMRRALDLALNGLGLAPPNPMVGAVVVKDGQVVGEGWHEGPGTPHAEVNALAAAGDRSRGATLYVTLEPCSHYGRTPPCAPAVIESGIARVVAGVEDPNPAVDGGGFAMLREAGLQVSQGVLSAECEELIAGFARHVRTGLPLVVLKMAASLDGKVAARDGSSRWITGEAARGDAHRLRAASGAIVVGAGTAAVDDPSLTVRLPDYRGRAPLRVLLDATGRTPATGSLFEPTAPTLVATTGESSAEARAAWEAGGAEVLVIDEPTTEGRVPLRPLMEALGKREIQHVLIEGGPTVAWSAVEEEAVDRLVLYLAPKLIGGRDAPGILGNEGVATIADAHPIRILRIERVGDDVKVLAEVGDVHRDR
jgi:diaminohydroxyphosphoribosylaminopyrimidine deaminase / 5-amino-6-(5-phosphoribosylamino)uracil reductase